MSRISSLDHYATHLTDVKLSQDSEKAPGEDFRVIFKDLMRYGKKTSPRGQLVIEIENYAYELPPRVRFCNFEARKLNSDYIKHEFLWYLRGDRFDQEILKHAKMWTELVNSDGSINSNYGQYIFTSKAPGFVRSQFNNVVMILAEDKNSRRASMTILDQSHLLSTTKDVPCTYALNFRIRENHLNMSVRMRSQDAVFGMGNDAPCFSLIQEMVYVTLRDIYPDLELGRYHHVADSFHVYERHFDVMEKIANGDPYIPLDCPEIKDSAEAKFLQTMIHFTYCKGEAYHVLEKKFYELSEAINKNPQLSEMISEKINNYNFSRWITTFKEN